MVVRNDLNPATIGYVSPQIVNQTLALSGFERVASFGPRIPSSASYLSAQPLAPGFAPSYPAVEVFQAASPASRPASPVAVLPVAGTVLVNGGPDSLLPLAGQGVVTSQPIVIAGDPLPVRPAVWAVTDGQRRADNEYGQTNQNVSFTYTATETNPSDDQFGGAGDPPRQLLPVPAAGHQTVAVLSGAAQVTASSYGDWLVQAPQYDPVNAFDGNSATAWAEGSAYTPVGQWIQVGFDRTLDLPSTVGIQLLVDDPDRSVATRVLVSTAAGSVSTDLADTGAVQALRVRPGATNWLRVTITAASNVVAGAPGAGFTDVLIPGVRVTRYLQPAEDPAGTQAASTVYSFRQEAPSPAAAPGPQASQVLARTFQVPAAQSFSVTAAAVAVPGAALDRLVGSLAPAGRSTFQVSASSTWDSLLQYGPDNLFSGSGPPWIASPADSTPVLHLTWPGSRTIGELILSPASGAAFPTSVEIASPQGTRLASVSPGGVVRVEPPLRTSQLYVIFPGTQSGAPGTGQLPVGLSRLTIPGLAGLRVAAPSDQATFRLACGQGPTVSVDGKQYPTEVSGTVADLIQSRPVQVQLCAPGAGNTTQLSLSNGQHWLLATPSSAFVVTDLDLNTEPDGTAARSASAAPSAAAVSGGQRPATLLTWQADRRSVRIGPGAESYLEIHENFNAGWSATLNGRPLTAVRLDGWQQAFIVPAGQGGVISLTYGPATVYHVGLIASALALLLLAVLAVLPALTLPAPLAAARPRRALARGKARSGPLSFLRRHVLPGRLGALRPGRRRPRRWPARWPWRGGSESPTRPWGRAARRAAVFVPLTVVIGLAGGPAAVAVPALACLGWWRPRWLPPLALGAMLIAGIVAASAGSPTALGGGAFGGLAQACALVALAAALMPEAASEDSGPCTTPADGKERAT